MWCGLLDVYITLYNRVHMQCFFCPQVLDELLLIFTVFIQNGIANIEKSVFPKKSSLNHIIMYASFSVLLKLSFMA